jgi:hypothetical protein
MADFEPSANGILTPAVAANMGQDAGKSFSQGIDAGSAMQERIAQAQYMHSKVQEQQENNNLSITNHVLDNMSQMAYYGSGSPQGKVLSAQLSQKLGQLGIPIDQDSLTAIAKDDDDRNELMAQISKWNQLQPDQQKQAIPMLKQMMNKDQFMKFSENMADLNAKAQMFQDRTQQQREMNLGKEVTGINKAFQTNDEFFNTAQSALNGFKNGSLTTGQAENDLKLALARAFQGGVPRAAQLNMMTQNRSISDKVEGYFQKLETGRSFQPDELKDLGKMLQSVRSSADDQRLGQLAPKYQMAKNSNFNLDNIFKADDQDRLEQYINKPRQQSILPSATASQLEKANQKRQSLNQGSSDYMVGSNPNIDSFLKSTISSGASYQQINKLMSRKNMKLSKDQYDRMAGGQ